MGMILGGRFYTGLRGVFGVRLHNLISWSVCVQVEGESFTDVDPAQLSTPAT